MSDETSEKPIDEQVKELRKAGWSAVRSVHHQPTPTFERVNYTTTTWQSPDGRLFRGPHGAWRQMKVEADV